MEITLYFAYLWDSLPKTYQVSIVVLFVIFMTLMIKGGVTNKLVIYYNLFDYVINLIVISCLIFAVFIWLNPEPFHSKILNFLYLYFLSFGLSSVALVLFITSSILAYHHNKNILIGIMVTVFKFVYALISTVGALLVLLLTIASLFNAIDKAKNKEYIEAAGHTFGVFVGLETVYLIYKFAIYSLINGEEVYEKRGLYNKIN